MAADVDAFGERIDRSDLLEEQRRQRQADEGGDAIAGAQPRDFPHIRGRLAPDLCPGSRVDVQAVDVDEKLRLAQGQRWVQPLGLLR